MKLLLMLPTECRGAAPEVLFRWMGALTGMGVSSPLNTGSGAGGGGAGGANFMFWRQPHPPKKMPLATTSPHTSARTTSRVWLALSTTLRFRGDSQCNCRAGFKEHVQAEGFRQTQGGIKQALA